MKMKQCKGIFSSCIINSINKLFTKLYFHMVDECYIEKLYEREQNIIRQAVADDPEKSFNVCTDELSRW